MLQLRLTFDNPTGAHPAPVPAACPRAGCGGGRVRHWQTVSKAVRGAAGGTVTAERYLCLDCRRTFRVYPAGVDRGTVPAAAKHWAAALHDLGLPYRDVARALAVLGVNLGKSRVQMLAKPLAGAGRPRPGWLGAVPERVEIEGGDTGAGKGEGAGAVAHVDMGVDAVAVAYDDTGVGVVAADDTDRGARAAAVGDGGQAEQRAWVWIDGRRHAMRRAVDAHGRVALVVDGVARDLLHIVDAWAGAMLAEHGVHAAVAYDGDAGRRRDGAAFGIVVGAFGLVGAVSAADDAGAPGLDAIGADLAAVAATIDAGGHRLDPVPPPFRAIPGDPPALRSTSAGLPPGFTPRRRGFVLGAGSGAPIGALAPRVGQTWHRPGRPALLESSGPPGACRAVGGTFAARAAA